MKEDHIKAMQLLNDIIEQSSRHKRASGLKPYLLTDLEIIESKAREVLYLHCELVTKMRSSETQINKP